MTDCGTTYRSLPMLNIWNNPPGPSAVLRITAACWRPSGVVETVTMSPVTSVTWRGAAAAMSAGAAPAPPAKEALPAKASAATMTTLNMRRATVNLPTWARGCAASDAPKPIRSCAVPMWRLSDIAGTSQIKRYMVNRRSRSSATAAGHLAHGRTHVGQVHERGDQRDQRQNVDHAERGQRADRATDDQDGEPDRLGQLVDGRERGSLAGEAVDNGPDAQRDEAPVEHPIDPEIEVVDQAHGMRVVVGRGRATAPAPDKPARGQLRMSRRADQPLFAGRRVAGRLAGAAFAAAVFAAGLAAGCA